MIEIPCVQGSANWHKVRAGKQTASLFHVMRASARLQTGPDAGDYGAAAKDLAFRLAFERISGEPLDDGFETWSMERGRELEPDARKEHQDQTGLIVETVGFVTTDDGLFGASLDGMIRPEGRAEYKCYVSPIKLRRILVNFDVSMVMDQCQGGLWVSEGEWMDFCLYCPALACAEKQLIRKRIYRDDNYIEDLESDLFEFKALIDQYEAVLRAPLPEAEIGEAKVPARLPRRRLPLPTAVHAQPVSAAPALSEFDRLKQRIVTASSEVAVELILDGCGHLPSDQVMALRELAANKFASV